MPEIWDSGREDMAEHLESQRRKHARWRTPEDLDYEPERKYDLNEPQQESDEED